MVSTMDNPPPATRALSNRQVDTIRGQYHKFMLIPPIEHHSRWFDAGPISIAVEARALGGEGNIVRGHQHSRLQRRPRRGVHPLRRFREGPALSLHSQ